MKYRLLFLLSLLFYLGGNINKVEASSKSLNNEFQQDIAVNFVNPNIIAPTTEVNQPDLLRNGSTPMSGSGWNYDGSTLNIFGTVTKDDILNKWHRRNPAASDPPVYMGPILYLPVIDPITVNITPDAKLADPEMRYMFSGFSKLQQINGLANLDTSRVTSMEFTFFECSSLKSIDLSNFNTSQVTNLWSTFDGCSSLTELDVSSFDTSKVITMQATFYRCTSLRSLDVSNFDTSNVENMWALFDTCTSLTSLNLKNFNTSHVTSMRTMFQNDQFVQLDLSTFDTSHVTDMSFMFNGCSNVEKLDLTVFDTSKVTTMESMFRGCVRLDAIEFSPTIDTSSLTNMYFMFFDCLRLTKLDVSHFNTSNVTNMWSTFDGCKILPTLDVSNFDTSKVTTMRGMFFRCNQLQTIDVSGFTTSNVTDMQSMFRECNLVEKLDVSGFDTSQVTNMQYMFATCSDLSELDVSRFNTEKVTDMEGMFDSCVGLSVIDVSNFVTDQVTSMAKMFMHCSLVKNLDVSGFNTSKATNMSWMFYQASAVQELDVSNFDTSKVTNMESMLANCYEIESLDMSNFNMDSVQPNGLKDMLSGTRSLFQLTVGPHTRLYESDTVNAGLHKIYSNQVYPNRPYHTNYITTGSWQEFFPDKDLDFFHASGDALDEVQVMQRHQTPISGVHTYIWQAINGYKSDKKIDNVNPNKLVDGLATVEPGKHTITTTFDLEGSNTINQIKVLPRTGTTDNVVYDDNNATIALRYSKDGKVVTTKSIPFHYGQVYTGNDFNSMEIPPSSVVTIKQAADIKNASNKFKVAEDGLYTMDPVSGDWSNLAWSPQINLGIANSYVSVTIPTQINFGHIVINNKEVNDPDTVKGQLSISNPESFDQQVDVRSKLTSDSSAVKNSLYYNQAPKYTSLTPIDGNIYYQRTLPKNSTAIIPLKRQTGDLRGVVFYLGKSSLPFDYVGQTKHATVTWTVTRSLN